MEDIQEKKLVRLAPIQSVERAIWILKCLRDTPR